MIPRIGLRELQRTWARALLLGLLVTLTMAVLGGGILATMSLYDTRDSLYDRLQLADLEIQFVPAASDEMPSIASLERIDGVAAVNRRFLSSGFIERSDGSPFPVLVAYLDPSQHPEVNNVQMLEGQYLQPDAPGRAVVHRSFAEKNGIAIDSTVVVDPATFPTEFEITGIGQSPEFLIPTANPNTLFPSKGSLGIIYASREKLDSMFLDELYNRLAVRYADGTEPDAVKRRILDHLDGLEIESVVPRSQNFGYRFLKEDLKGFYVFVPAVAGIFALLACIVIFVTINRLLSNRRREIGSMEALGYSPWSIAGSFLTISVVPALPAGLLAAVASVYFGEFIAGAYGQIVGLPQVNMTYPAWVFALVILGAPVLAAVGTALPLRGLFELEPMDALRERGNVQFGPLPDWLERPIRQSRPMQRLSFRNLFRRPGLSLAAVVLVALAIGLPAALQTSLTSWVGWTEQVVNAQEYDQLVSFKLPVDTTYARRISQTKGVADTEPYLTGYGSITGADGRSADMRIVGLPQDGRLQQLQITDGEWFSGPSSREIILNKNDIYGTVLPAVGERVTIAVDDREYRVEVAGWANELTVATMYLPLQFARDILDNQGQLSGYALTLTRDADAGATHRRLLGEEIVSNVQTREEVGNAMREYLASFGAVIDPLIGISILLSFLFLATVLGMLLLERDTEYATLRAIGIKDRSILQMVGTEVLSITAAALLVGAGVWMGLASLLRTLMASAWLDVGLTLTVGDFVTVALPAAVFLMAAAVPGAWRLLQLEMTRSLRRHELG